MARRPLPLLFACAAATFVTTTSYVPPAAAPSSSFRRTAPRRSVAVDHHSLASLRTVVTSYNHAVVHHLAAPTSPLRLLVDPWIKDPTSTAAAAWAWNHVEGQMNELPDLNPAAYVAALEELPPAMTVPPMVACVGDSITHGIVSADYVSMLGAMNPEITVVNGGRNGETSWNIAQRFADVLKCAPAVVLIMCGTNDCKATLSKDEAKLYCTVNGLPAEPTLVDYARNLDGMVKAAKATGSRVALLSPPPLGEDPLSKAWARSAEAAAVAAAVARSQQCDFIDVHSALSNFLADERIALGEQQALGTLDREGVLPPQEYTFKRFGPLSAKSLFERFGKRMTLEEIQAGNKLVMTTDLVHLSPKAAAVVAGAAHEYLARTGVLQGQDVRQRSAAV